MGWGSATELFDGAVDVALAFIPTSQYTTGLTSTPLGYSPLLVQAVVKEMYTRINWEDWDTQDESKYFYPYLMNVMIELDEIDE